MKGRAIIKDVMKARRIGVRDFFGSSRMTHLVIARRTAILRLKEAGFSEAAISRLMKRNYSTIQYWTHPGYRKRQVAYSLAYQRSRAGQESRAT